MSSDPENPIPEKVELYFWLNRILELRKEMEACNANAYQVLTEWEIFGPERHRDVRYLTELASALSEAQAKRTKSKAKSKG